jgi:hypothetical protein
MIPTATLNDTEISSRTERELRWLADELKSESRNEVAVGGCDEALEPV